MASEVFHELLEEPVRYPRNVWFLVSSQQQQVRLRAHLEQVCHQPLEKLDEVLLRVHLRDVVSVFALLVLAKNVDLHLLYQVSRHLQTPSARSAH